MLHSTSSRVLAAAAAVAAALASGCAGREEMEAVNGPSFYMAGEFAVREVDRPMRKMGFTWSRGRGYSGWEERIELTDRRGMKIAKLISENGRVRISARNREDRVTSLDALFARLLGAPLEPRILAGWLKNRHHEGEGPIADDFRYGQLAVEVRTRHLDETPKELRLHRGDNIYVILIRDQDAAN